ncbi:hypothetical protein OIDMADRAFT_150002 [Oidiodendron maius Zn]|uniref:C6 transcription factor n=1 Tax=Oidiodendron maius (strain Zn) TaxID=913774 RepID=A0A0C3G921_OIDMZ|nr:hypothetical protein OIDMADRAFT_150002 [Oidiodendron maius Zn]
MAVYSVRRERLRTCLSMTNRVPLQEFYKTTFITEALKSEHLLRLVLSVSALHLTEQHRETLITTDGHEKAAVVSKVKEYLTAADVHHSVALGSFRKRLANITAEDSHAIFGCAVLIAMASVARSCGSSWSFHLAERQKADENILEYLVLLRGIKSVLTETQEWVQAGPMSPIIWQPGNTGKDNKCITAYLDKLSAAFVESAEPKVAAICIDAIKLLRQSFARMESGCEPSIVSFWPVLVHEDYMELLRSSQPEALIVLGSYCVFLQSQKWCWWVKGWPAKTLKTIDGMVGDELRPWLRWCVELLHPRDSKQETGRVSFISRGP